MDKDKIKQQNLMHMMSLWIVGMATTLYELFDETVYAAMGQVGKDILMLMEEEMGLEVAGEDPKDLVMEVCRIFIDELGFMGSFTVQEVEGGINVKTAKCLGWNATMKILEKGAETPFTCPIMNVAHAALTRIGRPSSRIINIIPDARGCDITFRFVE